MDEVIFDRYAPVLGEKLGYFVESGAFDGVRESKGKIFEEFLGWSGISVEPFPGYFQQLVFNRPNSLKMNCALSSTNGSRELRQVVHPKLGNVFGNGSLSHTREHQSPLDKNGCALTQLEVPTITCDTLVETCGLPRVDLLSLDVEGHESEVLKGMVKKRYRPGLICVETGCDADGMLDQQLSSMGYRKHSQYQVNSFYLRVA